MVQTGAGVPDGACGRSASGTRSRILPNSLLVFVPLAGADPLRACAGPATAACCMPIGDNPVAARLSGARSWQVLIVLYMISAMLAAIAGLPHLRSRPTSRASRSSTPTSCRRSPRPSSAGRRSWAAAAGTPGTIVGALILTVLTSLLTVLGLPGGRPPGPLRRDHRRRGRGLHPGHQRDLMAGGPAAGRRAASAGGSSSTTGSSAGDDRHRGRVDRRRRTLGRRALRRPRARISRPGSSTSMSTAGAATTRWATQRPSTGWPGACCAAGVTSFLPTAVTAPIDALAALRRAGADLAAGRSR